MNIIFVISSPAGVGKTTICNIESSKNSDVGRVVTHTTRAPRPNETNGQDYYFVSRKDFENALKNGEMVEYASVHGNYYGTSKKALAEILKSAKDALLAVDVQGARNIMQQFDSVVSIFILPPSFDVWLNRIQHDNLRNDVNIRLKTALYELNAIREFDFCIINDELERTIFSLESIINSQHNKMEFVEQERTELTKKLSEKAMKYLEG